MISARDPDKPAGPVEQPVVVVHQIRRRAHRVPPPPVAGRRGGRQPVPVRDVGDDRLAAARSPERLRGAVVGGAQHAVQRLAVCRRQRLFSSEPADPVTAVVSDEQLGHRGDRDELVVAVGQHLPGGSVEDRNRDGGAVGGGVLGGLRDAGRQSVEPGAGHPCGDSGGLIAGGGAATWRACDAAPGAPYTFASKPSDAVSSADMAISSSGRARMALDPVPSATNRGHPPDAPG